MSQTLMKINSKYILRSIFSFLNYDNTLKLIKNNKKISELVGINISNYKNRTNYQYLERKTIIKNNSSYEYGLQDCCKYCCSFILASILFIYVIIFASILVSKGAFNESNTKDNYSKNYLKIIDKINLSLFGFLAYIIFSYFLIFVWATSNCYSDYGLIKIIKKVLLIILGIAFLSYDILIIIKLKFSYKIKKDNITWFMRCDYVLIILIFIYFAYIVFIIVCYFLYVGNLIRDGGRQCILKKFRDFEINDYVLPENFKQMNEYEKRKYIFDNKNSYTIKNQKDLINEINKLRTENNIEALNWDKEIYFEDLIFDKYSESFLNDYKNIFKLSNRKYLLKYPFNEFQIRFNKSDKNLIDILLNDNLNKIIIIKKNSILFILIYRLNYDINNNLVQLYSERNQDEIHTKIPFRESYIYEDKYYDC